MQLAGIKNLDKRQAFFVKKLKTIERNMTVSLQLFSFPGLSGKIRSSVKGDFNEGPIS